MSITCVNFTQNAQHVLQNQFGTIMKMIFLSLMAYVLALQTIRIQALHLHTLPSQVGLAQDCKQAAIWTLVPHAYKCQNFFVCDGRGSYQEYSCGAEYHFNRTKMHCMPGPCNETPLIPQASCTPNTVLRVREDCSRYRSCTSNGFYELTQCASGQYFDVAKRSCMPVKLTPDHQCSCLLPEHSTLPNPGDCETYFSCQNGLAVLQQCPRDQYYDQNVGSCLLDTTGVCLEHATKPPVSLSEALALDDCISTGSRLAPHSSDCSQFYLCVPRRVVLMSCPSGKSFDPVRRYCRKDANNECNVNVEPSKADKPVRPKPPTKQLDAHKAPPAEVDSQAVAKQPPHTIVVSPEMASNYDKLTSKFMPF